MPEAVAVTAAESGRRRSLIGSTVIAVAFLMVSIVFAANTQPSSRATTTSCCRSATGPRPSRDGCSR